MKKSDLPRWALHKRPWDAARKLSIVRYDYREEGEVIDPGVNFFVLTLEALGARPKYSCEGHPEYFYIMFKAPFRLAQEIARISHDYHVEISSGDYHGPNHWVLRLRDIGGSESLRVFILRRMARLWQREFWFPLLDDV